MCALVASTSSTFCPSVFQSKGFARAATSGYKFKMSASFDKIELTKVYFKRRLSGDNAGVLELVADNVTLESSRDGKYVGKDEMAKYLEKVKPTGQWGDPADDGENKTVVKGHVKLLFVPIGVISHFQFNPADGKIVDIKIGRQ
eukprot:jgi/Mesvir1/3225/Mv16373-RA.1